LSVAHRRAPFVIVVPFGVVVLLVVVLNSRVVPVFYGESNFVHCFLRIGGYQYVLITLSPRLDQLRTMGIYGLEFGEAGTPKTMLLFPTPPIMFILEKISWQSRT
jgi:hypothetical protein